MNTRLLILALALIAAITALAITHVLTAEDVLQLFESLGGVGAGAGITHLIHTKTSTTDTTSSPAGLSSGST